MDVHEHVHAAASAARMSSSSSAPASVFAAPQRQQPQQQLPVCGGGADAGAGTGGFGRDSFFNGAARQPSVVRLPSMGLLSASFAAANAAEPAEPPGGHAHGAVTHSVSSPPLSAARVCGAAADAPTTTPSLPSSLRAPGSSAPFDIFGALGQGLARAVSLRAPSLPNPGILPPTQNSALSSASDAQLPAATSTSSAPSAAPVPTFVRRGSSDVPAAVFFQQSCFAMGDDPDGA
uniref:Uncharacterized protein n=1 Tax=Chlamydomonas euryale TaxID=1486919 RepID=A0A7R9VE65_9CHLO|mmetsp:Transcript_33128/g.98556  ORF Transcript_33128/g.98556 Transcript_33128/m.98556 type:complete len:234 (+) Transcript_33128:896-1597(+)